MTYENITLKEHDRGDGIKIQSSMIPFFQTFVEKLALKYPQWTFVEDSHNYKWDNVSGKSVKTDIRATCFKVLDKREELGSIYYENHYNGTQRYCVDNFRVQKMRERGCGMKTIHEKKAIKHVDKYFGARNLDEKLIEASNRAKQTMYQVGNDLSNKFTWGWNGINSVAQEFLISKYWEEFSEYVMSRLKTNVTDLASMPEKFEKSQAGQAIRECVNSDKHYLVYVDNQSYAIFRKGEPTQIKASEELPEYIRRSVGMLKLIEDNQILSGVGCRVDSATYIVLPQN